MKVSELKGRTVITVPQGEDIAILEDVHLHAEGRHPRAFAAGVKVLLRTIGPADEAHQKQWRSEGMDALAGTPVP